MQREPQVVYESDDNYSDIFVNNITFDGKSERLAWTFDHTVSRKSYDTTVAFWDTKTRCPLNGFKFGRYRFRERVQFARDPQFLFMCRMGFSKWDIELGRHPNERALDQRQIPRSENSEFGTGNLLDMQDWLAKWIGLRNPLHSAWIIGHFSQGEYIRLDYISENILVVCFRSAEPNRRFVVQIFRGRSGNAIEYKYDSELEEHLRYPMAFRRNGFTLGDRIVQIVPPKSISSKRVCIETPSKVKATAFHLSAGLMACIEEASDEMECLKLYTANTQPISQIKSTVFFQRGSCAQDDPLPFTIVFDPSQKPKFLFILSSQVNEECREPGSSSPSDTSENLLKGTVYISRFEIPSLRQVEEFMFANYWPRISHYAWRKMLAADFDIASGKLICAGECGDLMYRQIWIIDTDKQVGISQSFPAFRWLRFIGEKGTVVAITEDRWIQSKTVRDMESEIARWGDGRAAFDASIDPWILQSWKRLTCIPPSLLPCWESGVAIHPITQSGAKGQIAFIGEFGKQLVQISFDWD